MIGVLPGTLYKIEGYNGWGYRMKHPQVYSPYLWGFSNHYQKGKYIADGTWSDNGSFAAMRRSSFIKKIIREK